MKDLRSRPLFGFSSLEKSVSCLGEINDNITELVSSGINDVYLLKSGKYLKIFNQDFVCVRRLEGLYHLLQGNTHLFCLPLLNDATQEYITRRKIGRTHIFCAIYPPARGSPLSPNHAISIAACEQVQTSLAAVASQCLDAPIRTFRRTIDRIRADLAAWMHGTARTVGLSILDRLTQIERFHLDEMTKQKFLQHGDFHHSNVFVDGDNINIIDMDFFCFAPVGYDAATLGWKEARLNFASDQNFNFSIPSSFKTMTECLTFSPNGLVRYWLSLLVLRHLFFLSLQIRLWRYRGSAYANGVQTFRELSFLDALIHKLGSST